MKYKISDHDDDPIEAPNHLEACQAYLHEWSEWDPAHAHEELTKENPCHVEITEIETGIVKHFGLQYKLIITTGKPDES